MADINDGSGKGLLLFLEWAIEKGEINKASAEAMKSSVNSVLQYQDNWEEFDLRSIEPDEILLRFRNKAKRNYNTKSLQTYQTRFLKAVDMYIKWLDGRSDWRPSTRNVRGKKTSTLSETNLSTETVPSQKGYEYKESSVSIPVIEYPFPIRPGLRARLWLPEDITTNEANRLTAFIHSLTVDSTAPEAVNQND